MSAEYAIEIAASMPAGETTNAQLDQMIQGLTGAGKGADFFQTAMKQVSASLDQAKATAAAANGALADGNAQYRELEKAANMAAKAVEKAGTKGVIDPKLSAESARADAALQGYARTLRGLEQNAAAATKSEAAFAAQLANVRKLASHVDKTLAGSAEATEKLRGGLAAVPGPVGKIGSSLLAPVQGFQKLSAEMGSSNALMLLTATAAAGLVVGVIALTAAVIAGTIAIAAWAVGLADGKRSAALAQEAVEAMNPAIAEAAPLFGAITKETGQTAAELNGLVKSLKAAKVSAEDMPDALRAAALAEAALGKGGSADFLANIKEGKVAVSQLAAETQGKLGGIVAKQMRGLDAQTKTFKKNIGELFGGLNIEPVLAGLERLVGLFDANTAAGQTIKFLFESVFQPLIDQADKAALVIESFALGFLIGMTKLYIALKPAIKAVKEFFGFEDTGLTDTLDMAKKAGELIVPVFLVFAGIMGLVVGAIVLAVAQFVAIQLAIYAVIAAVVYAGVAIVQGIVGAWQAVTSYLSEIDLAETGAQILQGLANGITGAAGFVKDAVANAVNGAIKSAKDLLGIASPSKVFAEIGGYTGEGFAGGVDDAAPDAQAAMIDMVDPAPAAAKSKRAGSGDSGDKPGSAGSSYAGAVFNFYGVEGAEDAIARFREMLTLAQEGDLAALGGGEPATS
jgi:hypothetical protein